MIGWLDGWMAGGWPAFASPGAAGWRAGNQQCASPLVTRFTVRLYALQTDCKAPALKGRYDIAQGEALGGACRTTSTSYRMWKVGKVVGWMVG